MTATMTTPPALPASPAPAADPVLRVQGARKHFTLHLRGGLQLPVLEGVDLQVAAGECLALVGASGRGKSTLLKCLHGSYGLDGGALWLTLADGRRVDLAQAEPRTVLALRRRDIAYVSQFLRALPRQSALDLVAERLLEAAPLAPFGLGVGVGPGDGAADIDPLDDAPHEAALAAARAQAGALLARLNLPESLWGLPPATFSGGEQQRVNIARGFAVPARLLLLDEPTASLDAGNRRVVTELILEAKARGSAIVGIFHDEAVRDAVADRRLDFH